MLIATKLFFQSLILVKCTRRYPFSYPNKDCVGNLHFIYLQKNDLSLLKVYYTTFGLLAISFCYLMINNAYAEDFQVTIVNGTANHCSPLPSCYKPFQVNISVGDTVTWINQDNHTHTATAGTSNYGPVGIFDSGSILPGHLYSQFFGTVGKYQYFDRTDMWPSGIVIVDKGTRSHPELQWVNGSLITTRDNTTSSVIVSKQIQNTGDSDANSILFRLKIRNQTGFLFYDHLTMANVPANQGVAISFAWTNPPIGRYQLNFEANAANTIGDTNAKNDLSTDIISISNYTKNQQNFLTENNFTLNKEEKTIPEFGSMSYVVLVASLFLIVTLSSKFILKYRV